MDSFNKEWIKFKSIFTLIFHESKFIDRVTCVYWQMLQLRKGGGVKTRIFSVKTNWIQHTRMAIQTSNNGQISHFWKILCYRIYRQYWITNTLVWFLTILYNCYIRTVENKISPFSKKSSVLKTVFPLCNIRPYNISFSKTQLKIL